MHLLEILVNHRRSIETFRDYKYLGTRVRLDGTVGEYVSVKQVNRLFIYP